MSATGRPSKKGKTKRRSYDHYPTPYTAIDPVLRILPLHGMILEPACGEGAIIGRLIEAGVRPENIRGCELNKAKGFRAAHRYGVPVNCWQSSGNFLVHDWEKKWDLIITNPPYSCALSFVRHALEHAHMVAMLLRLPFVASGGRKAFMRETKPHLGILSSRPSFTGGGSDATEYAWFCWRLHGKSGTYELL